MAAPSSPSTSLSLIRRVRERDSLAWENLVEIYSPLVYQWCRRRGVQAADAMDVTQEVFIGVSFNIDRFQREGGRQTFRAWLYTITTRRIYDRFRKQKKQPVSMDRATLEETVAVEFGSESYCDQRDVVQSDLQLVVASALDIIRSKCTTVKWQAFWRTAIDGLAAPVVANELGIEAAHVRKLKSRVLQQLRTELKDLESDL